MERRAGCLQQVERVLLVVDRFDPHKLACGALGVLVIIQEDLVGFGELRNVLLLVTKGLDWMDHLLMILRGREEGAISGLNDWDLREDAVVLLGDSSLRKDAVLVLSDVDLREDAVLLLNDGDLGEDSVAELSGCDLREDGGLVLSHLDLRKDVPVLSG